MTWSVTQYSAWSNLVFSGIFQINIKYFINENDTIEKLPESCYVLPAGFNQSHMSTQNLTLSQINNDSGIIYPYIICGVTVTVTGVIFYILHCQNVLKKIGEQNASIEDKREDAPINATLLCFFGAVIINLFGIQVKRIVTSYYIAYVT